MVIALCGNENTERMKRTLSTCGEVVLFKGAQDRPPSVQLAYYLARGEPCDLAVVARDGAAGMNDCQHIKGRQKDLPVLWISEQEMFRLESRRMGVEAFLVKPVPMETLEKVVMHLRDVPATRVKYGTDVTETMMPLEMH